MSIHAIFMWEPIVRHIKLSEGRFLSYFHVIFFFSSSSSFSWWNVVNSVVCEGIGKKFFYRHSNQCCCSWSNEIWKWFLGKFIAADDLSLIVNDMFAFIGRFSFSFLFWFLFFTFELVFSSLNSFIWRVTNDHLIMLSKRRAPIRIKIKWKFGILNWLVNSLNVCLVSFFICLSSNELSEK